MVPAACASGDRDVAAKVYRHVSGTLRGQLRDRERYTSINGFGILIFARVNFIALYSG